MSTEALEPVMKALDGLEAKMNAFAEKAEGEFKEAGKVSTETNNAIEALGLKQRELADQILELKQRGIADGSETKEDDTTGDLFVKSDEYKNNVNRIAGGQRGISLGLEVKNTVTNTVANTFSDRPRSFVGGQFRPLTLEDLLNKIPTNSNSIDYVKENVFTNSAAEVAEGAAKPESAITTTLVQEPVATVAHWIKISRQLASDNAALAAYINTRMIYGVNLRVENQIIAGTGVAPNMSGFTKSGNFTAHGYSAANLTSAGLSATNRFDLVGKVIGDMKAADYVADVVLLNPADWWNMILTKDTTNQYILGGPAMVAAPTLWGLPVVASNAVTADTFIVAALNEAATFYTREGISIQMSDSDSDNFTKNLITILAERRCCLAVEKPGAVRYGDITPS